jgi:hypothetical protein
VNSNDNEFEILMGRIGNRGRRESFINEVLRDRRQAAVEPGSQKEGWSGGRPLRRSGEAAPRSAAVGYSPPIDASSSRPGWSVIKGMPAPV